MIELTKKLVLFISSFSLGASVIWGIFSQDQRWFSRMALSAILFAAYGIMIRLDEIIKQHKK